VYQISDPRFLRAFCRLVGWPSRYLEGSPIVIDGSRAHLEIHITNGICSLVGIAWVDQRAVLLPGSSLLSPRHLDGYDFAFTSLVRRLLHTHQCLSAATHRGVA
jgi:hypothetical protein